ncbi:MAG: two-component regulator propeller domain-containing protein, partial [Flavisolibacter sp.]
MKYWKKILFIIISLPVAFGYAQDLPSYRYTSKNGLIADRITAIVQDRNGYMWFGSYFGICKYDGNKFEKILLPANQQNKYVNNLYAAYGNLYASFLFGGGLAVYSKGKVIPYFLRGKDSVTKNEFTALLEVGDSTLLLSNSLNELYLFKNGTFTFLSGLPLNRSFKITYLQKDSYNSIWIGTENGLFLSPYPYRSFKRILENKNIILLCKDSSNQLSVGFKEKNLTHIYKYKGSNNGTLLEVRKRSFKNAALIPSSGTSNGGMWLMDHYGKMTFVDDNDHWLYCKPDLELTTEVNFIYTDRENNLWIANEPGVVKITNLRIQVYYFKELAAAGGSMSLNHDSDYYVSNSKFLYTISKEGNIKKVPDLRSRIHDLYGKIYTDSHSDIWIAFWNGGIWRTKWKDGKLLNKTFYYRYNGIIIKASSIAEDSKGNLWVGGANGIFYFHKNKVRSHIQPLNSNGYPAFVTTIALNEKDNTIWVGDNNSGIIKLKYNVYSDSLISYKTDFLINSQQGLKDSYIRALYLDVNNDLWIGTRYGGIYRLKNGTNTYNVINYNSKAKMSCTRVTDIIGEDSVGIWFATCEGIYRYDLNKELWKHFTTSDGLLNTEV